MPNKTVRRSYEKTAVEQQWSTRELIDAIKAKEIHPAGPPKDATIPVGDPLQLEPRRGRLYTYRVLPPSDEAGMLIDMGFKLTYKPTSAEAQAIGTATVVTTTRQDRRGYAFQAVEDASSRFYTFCARIEKVIDGDTLWVWIDYGFRVGGRRKLRLRGIDTPEMSTRAGVHAREAVVDWLADVPFIVLSTSQTDKYDRYVADVFYLAGEVTPEVVLQEGVYLNQRLLDEGLAKAFVG